MVQRTLNKKIMEQCIKKIIATLFLLLSLNIYASSLTDDAIKRGINETCTSYLGQIEKSYNLTGLNITFAHPENPSYFLHFIYPLKNIIMGLHCFQQL